MELVSVAVVLTVTRDGAALVNQTSSKGQACGFTAQEEPGSDGMS
jgi:hypothetical protein